MGTEPKKIEVDQEKEKEKVKNHELVITLDRFIENIESIHGTFPLFMDNLNATRKKASDEYLTYMEKYGTLLEDTGDRKRFGLDRKHFLGAKRLRIRAERAKQSLNLIPRNFVVSLVSEYDSFLGNLLKVFFIKKPELLQGVERQISYSDLVNYKSIEDAREYILEKEIESVLRKSHTEHFEILEKKFNIDLRKGLDIWPTFVEITERRNLFVHCDGIISSQYLQNCSKQKCIVDDVKLGDKLDAPIEYIQQTFQILNELSIKLSHVLWRKVLPEERDIADTALINLSFELLHQERYDLVSNVLDLFVNTINKFHDETTKRILVINLALSYKLANKREKCNQELKRYDWSAISYDFKIAHASLTEQYDKASEYMEKLIATGDMGEIQFLEWPIFKEFRESEYFVPAFKKCFGKDPFEDKSLEVNEIDDQDNVPEFSSEDEREESIN